MGCDQRGDGDNNNIRRRSSEVVDEDEVPYTGLRTRVVCSTDRVRISRQQMKANRRWLKKHNLLLPRPRMTKDDPMYGHIMVPTLGGPPAICYVLNGRAISAAEKRREAGSKPVVNQVMNPVAPSSQPTATGTKAKGIQGSLLKHPREDLNESTKSLLENPIPAADSLLEIAKAKGGSVLKRHRVDLGESSDIRVENLSSASDPSPTAEAEEKGGSVPNKDVGAQAEVKGGSILKRPAADPSATVCTKDEVEGGSVLKRACVNLGESSALVAGNLNPADPLAATGTVANVKGGYVLNKDLGESHGAVVESEPWSQYMRHYFI